MKKPGISINVAKSASYLLGLDAGNTVIKAVLFDLEGRQLAVQAMDGQSSTPAPGYVERDLGELWRNAQATIRGCIEKAGVRADEIAAVGCAGHGNGLYLLDKSDEPLLGIQSLDSRAADLALELGAGTNGSLLQEMSLQKPWPSQTPTLLAWIKRNQPETFARAGTLLLCKDFITFKLTGRRVSDLSDMSGCGLVSLPDGRYDDSLLAAYGLEGARELLPPIIDPSDIAGEVTAEAAVATGLAEGTPVVGGLFDVVASALGSGAVEAGQASIVVGTWSINQVLSRSPVIDPAVFMVSVFGPERFINIESSATSAANLEWYLRTFVEREGHHDDPFGHCNRLVSGVTPAADDPLYHPYLFGSRLGAERRAGFYGLAGWHGEGHLLRALYEGVVFEHRRHVEVLSQAGIAFEQVALSGGGTRSPVWPQIFADCLGKPMNVAECRETGALGAALTAGCGVGIFENYEEAVGRMTRPRQIFAPDPAMKSHYDRRYRLFLDLAERMTDFWSTL